MARLFWPLAAAVLLADCASKRIAEFALALARVPHYRRLPGSAALATAGLGLIAGGPLATCSTGSVLPRVVDFIDVAAHKAKTVATGRTTQDISGPIFPLYSGA